MQKCKSLTHISFNVPEKSRFASELIKKVSWKFHQNILSTHILTIVANSLDKKVEDFRKISIQAS